MDTLALIIILAAAFGISLWVSRPFNQPEKASQTAKTRRPEVNASLEGEHQRLLDALQELDFDHTQAKLNEEDYAAQRLVLLQSGADVLRRMDEGQ
jgi:hypothetical protein